MIKVKNLKKSFGDNTVLKGINTEFESGKINLVIGQSGSGKSVFLKSLLNVYEPEEGEIFFDDRDILTLSSDEKQDLRADIGMVFQGGALFDSLTVAENISFPLEMFSHMSASEKRDRTAEVMDSVHLKDTDNKYPAEISGGMQKRVAIARAIVNNPKYLFFDEPNSGLDPFTSKVIDELIMEITKEYDTTTVINTHDMNSVMTIGEKIVYLKDGYCEWEGTKETVVTAENENLIDFVYSSELFKEVREYLLESRK